MNPVLKWVGGKRQLLNKIKELMPKEYDCYYEPFIGGGALLFDIEPKRAVINDMNSELVNVYKVLSNKNEYVKLISKLDEHQFNHSKEYYYSIRELDRSDDYKLLPKHEKAARIIYLNKAGYNGLYRVNSKGYYNVPFGQKEKVNLYSKENIDEVNKFFCNNDIKIVNVDFEEAVSEAKKGDFVYFDPPYDNLDNKESFTSYTKDSFTREDQIRLFNTFEILSKLGVKVMLSNHYTEFIKELYKDYKIKVVSAKRLVNSNSNGRGDVLEVIITNYD
ncbi:DNA adenine methylase [Haploplasma axanthum]|uniref:Site-specific DNA-methyltransferase (adenine-specific) n=1 Tax=Haploplasma axanthum TaxID=29552 RepID=A0A449BBT5_HAPAX|nr:DNA adenine methylase [Haploplasma axanthum]VEU79898.1 adenine-specific DNA methyltransferase [Haploplasma axanthum]